ncbi:MAG TPA: hypothetical protein VHA56_18765 [Mucilaginibacter sp.]|nr:hypothetical protein [Mucilaginibacter sp.]
MTTDKEFKIEAIIAGNVPTSLDVEHVDETFNVRYQNELISMINNGDNSWSEVYGNHPQELINQLGQAIENYFSRQSP